MLLLFVSSPNLLEAAYIYFHYCIHLKTWNAERGRKVREHLVILWFEHGNVLVILLERGGLATITP